MRSMSVGIGVGGPTTRTRAPMICSRWMFEARHAAVHDVAADRHQQAFEAAASSSDGERIEQRLRWMLVLAVAAVDDGAVHLLRQEIDRARSMVPHDDGVGPHGVQRHRRVEQRRPLRTEEVATSMLITSAPSRLAATSKLVRVRVEFSKNRLITVRPASTSRRLSMDRFWSI